MMNSTANRWWLRTSLAAVLGFALLGGGAVLTGAPVSAPALAQDEDEAFDTRMIRGFLRGLGLRRDGDGPNIDYRERSPLVVPPSRDLPRPETAAAERNPAWPVDPDVKRARQAKADRNKPRKSVEEEAEPLLPSELQSRNPRAARGDQRPTGSSEEAGRRLTASELGSKSLFQWGNLWGGKREEYATFTSEPPRGSLTEPPAGYRTPSAAQPYGVGRERYTPKAENPMDTPMMRGEN